MEVARLAVIMGICATPLCERYDLYWFDGRMKQSKIVLDVSRFRVT